MGITAKELAKKLGISAAAVSLALNGKPGVSTATRKQIRLAAEQYGYDFTKIKPQPKTAGSIYFIIYKKYGAIVGDTPFFAELSEGISMGCNLEGYKCRISYLYESELSGRTPLDLNLPDCCGVILLATEMTEQDVIPFLSLPFPLLLLDSFFENLPLDSIQINNIQGAFQAASHLIEKRRCQPGYLRSSYPIHNFDERAEGFYKSVRAHGMSASRSIVHRLTPSLSGAYADMKELLRSKAELAAAYFADNDHIAAGAMRAFLEEGFRIPEDIAIVGFDNLPSSQVLSPPLTTIHVPKEYLGRHAALRLSQRISHPDMPPVKTEVSTCLIDRYSC